MSQQNRGTVTMQFNDGVVFSAWEQVSLRDTYTDPLGELTFVTKPLRKDLPVYREHLRKGNLVSVSVNDNPQGVHVIQTVDKKIDRAGGVEFDVTCHTPLITAIESDANPDYSFASNTSVTITSIVGELLRPFGFEEVFTEIENDVNLRAGKQIVKGKTVLNVKALKGKDLQVHEGEAVYSVITRLANVVGVAVRCDVGGRILLCFPRYDQPVAYTVVQDFDGRLKGDRFLDGIEVHDTNDGQFSECVVRGAHDDEADDAYAARPQARYVLESSKAAIDKFTFKVPFDKIPITTFKDSRFTYRSDKSTAPYKPKVVRDKMGGDSKQCLSTAKLCIGMRASKAFAVTGMVDGWISQTSRVWSIDTIGRVVVEADEFDEEMWLLERVLMMGRNGAQATKLRWIPKNSLILGNAVEDL